MPETVTIVNVNDHEVVRRGLAEILAPRPEWQIVGEAEDGDSAIELISRFKPDVVTTDFAHPGPDGLEIIRHCKRTLPDTKTLLATMYASKQLVCELMKAGGTGYMMLSDASRDLVPAIDAILAGQLWFQRTGISETLLDGFRDPPQPPGSPAKLTKREIEMVKQLATGKAVKEVAQVLNISLRTAETHRAKIMHKLQLRSIQDLVRYAVGEKLVEL